MDFMYLFMSHNTLCRWVINEYLQRKEGRERERKKGREEEGEGRGKWGMEEWSEEEKKGRMGERREGWRGGIR